MFSHITRGQTTSAFNHIYFSTSSEAWALAYQLPLAVNLPEESIRVQQVASPNNRGTIRSPDMSFGF